MATFEEILGHCRVERVQLTMWVERRWVRPAQTPTGFEFDAVDEARVALIKELHDDLNLEEEALDLVLSLLDQLYAARRMLRTVEDAIEALPEPLQREVRSRLRGPAKG